MIILVWHQLQNRHEIRNKKTSVISQILYNKLHQSRTEIEFKLRESERSAQQKTHVFFVGSSLQQFGCY